MIASLCCAEDSQHGVLFFKKFPINITVKTLVEIKLIVWVVAAAYAHPDTGKHFVFLTAINLALRN